VGGSPTAHRHPCHARKRTLRRDRSYRRIVWPRGRAGDTPKLVVLDSYRGARRRRAEYGGRPLKLQGRGSGVPRCSAAAQRQGSSTCSLTRHPNGPRSFEANLRIARCLAAAACAAAFAPSIALADDLGDKPNRSYVLEAPGAACLVADVAWWSTDEYAPIVEWYEHDGANQQWELLRTPTDSGEVAYRSRAATAASASGSARSRRRSSSQTRRSETAATAVAEICGSCTVFPAVPTSWRAPGGEAVP
jgi:hypothetical protein